MATAARQSTEKDIEAIAQARLQPGESSWCTSRGWAPALSESARTEKGQPLGDWKVGLDADTMDHHYIDQRLRVSEDGTRSQPL